VEKAFGDVRPAWTERYANELYHNNGNGTLRTSAEKSGISKTDPYYCFTALTGDFDNDGWPDIFVACDSTPSLLFRNNHDGTFTDVAVKAGVAYNEDGREEAGMGADAGDYDGDGWLVSSGQIFPTTLPRFITITVTVLSTDVTYVSGLGANTQFLGWERSL